jgi:hypothetical protein
MAISFLPRFTNVKLKQSFLFDLTASLSSLVFIRDHPRKSAVQGFTNCQLLIARCFLPRINADFFSHFHIQKNR